MGKTKPPTLGRREQKKIETRRRLTEAALHLFTERGFDATRVEDITSRAGVAVGTFFNYFRAKEAILQGLQRGSVEHTIAHAESLTDGSAQDRFRAQFRYLASRTQKGDGRLTRIFFGRIMETPQITSPNRPLIGALFDTYAGWLEDGKATGEVREDVDSLVVATILHEMWSHSSLRWSTHPHEIDLEERMDQRLDVVFRGLGQ